jgi:hypothetical protein
VGVGLISEKFVKVIRGMVIGSSSEGEEGGG